MSFGDLLRRAEGVVATAALPIDDEDKVFDNWLLPRRQAWYARPERERVWTPEALEFARKVLAGELKQPRQGRISPSAMGTECERELLFAFAQAPQVGRPPENEAKMESGTFEHLRWQMAGLSAGYLTAGETFLHSEELRCGGSVDGVGSDGSLFELKNTAPHLYKCIVDPKGTERSSAWNYAQDMHRKHLVQMETYLLVDSLQPEPIFNGYASLVYQNSDDKAVFEFRLHSSPSRAREVHRILESAHDWIDLDDLPDLIPACQRVLNGEMATDKDHRRYGGCAYREYCPTATTVSVAR